MSVTAQQLSYANNIDSSKELEEYAYIVSHDLSAPVRAMVEFAKLFMEEYGEHGDENAREYLGLIVENGYRLQAMMDGLLAYSRLNTQARPYSHFNMRQLLQNLLDAEFSTTHCILETPDPAIIYADMEQIRQLLIALLSNAVKFQPEGGVPEIRIYVRRGPHSWQCAINDNGIGIAPQFQERIFKLFQRLHTDEEYPGIGIGLTLARKIIHRHGGKIWCESAGFGKGSTCYFTLPYSEEGTL